MSLYFKIEDGVVVDAIKLDTFEAVSAQESALMAGETLEKVTESAVPLFNPETQVREVSDLWDGVNAIRTHSVRDKTPEELAADQIADDLVMLREAGKDLALVLTELVQWTLDNTSMLPNDFTESVRTAYLDLKAIADRVK